jgi:hypothetical protein
MYEFLAFLFKISFAFCLCKLCFTFNPLMLRCFFLSVSLFRNLLSLEYIQHLFMHLHCIFLIVIAYYDFNQMS